MKNWGIHLCPLDRTCRETGAPMRLYIHTPWWSLVIGAPSQTYDRKTKRYTERWSHVAWHPRRRARNEHPRP